MVVKGFMKPRKTFRGFFVPVHGGLLKDKSERMKRI